MNIVEYLWMLVKAYNPNQYEKLIEKRWHEFSAFLIVTVLFSLLLFTIILVPMTMRYLGEVPGTTAEMQVFQLNATVKVDHPITLLERPNIVLDLQANETQKGEFTLTNEGIIYPKYLFFGTGIIKWDDIQDLKQQTPTRDSVLDGIIIFLLPSIIFWLFLFSMVKLLLVLAVFVFLGYFVPRIFRHTISFIETVKVAILAIPSFVIMDLGLYPLATPVLSLWGLGLSLVYFVIGVSLISELAIEHESHHHKLERK